MQRHISEVCYCMRGLEGDNIVVLVVGEMVRKEGQVGERMAQGLLWCDAKGGIQLQHCLHHVGKQGQI